MDITHTTNCHRTGARIGLACYGHTDPDVLDCPPPCCEKHLPRRVPRTATRVQRAMIGKIAAFRSMARAGRWAEVLPPLAAERMPGRSPAPQSGRDLCHEHRDDEAPFRPLLELVERRAATALAADGLNTRDVRELIEDRVMAAAYPNWRPTGGVPGLAHRHARHWQSAEATRRKGPARRARSRPMATAPTASDLLGAARSPCGRRQIKRLAKLRYRGRLECWPMSGSAPTATARIDPCDCRDAASGLRLRADPRLAVPRGARLRLLHVLPGADGGSRLAVDAPLVARSTCLARIPARCAGRSAVARPVRIATNAGSEATA